MLGSKPVQIDVVNVNICGPGGRTEQTIATLISVFVSATPKKTKTFKANEGGRVGGRRSRQTKSSGGSNKEKRREKEAAAAAAAAKKKRIKNKIK